MKSRKGYMQQKCQSNTGRYLKRYFTKRTCRKEDIEITEADLLMPIDEYERRHNIVEIRDDG